MPPRNISQTLALCLGVLVLTFLIGLVVFAWTEPGTAPPGGNVPAPINTGDTGQQKTGALRVGGFISDYATNLAALSGNVGIGTTSPSTKLTVSIADNTGFTNWPNGTSGIGWEPQSFDALQLTNPGTANSGEITAIYFQTKKASDGTQNKVARIGFFRTDAAAGSALAIALRAPGSNALIEVIRFANSGSVGINNLAGTGTRMVVANATGLLSAQEISGGVTWPLLAPDGTAAAPSYSFANNSNLGIFRPTANTLAFTTAGTERLRIDGAGNVGIGTTSPDSNYKLTTVGGGIKAENTSAQPAGYFSSGGGGPAIMAGTGAIVAGTGGISLGGVTKTAWPSSQWVDGTGGAIYYNNGNVGIGTTSPGTRLEVSNDADAILRLTRDGASYPTIFKVGADNAMVIKNSNINTLTLTDGNVGIGTTSPDSNYKLTTAGGGIKAENNSDSQPAGYFSNNSGGIAIQTGTGDILFGKLAGGGTRMVVTDNGGVLYAQEIPEGIIWPLRSTTNGTDSAPAYSWLADTDMGIRRGSADNLRFVTAGADRLTIDATGSVGIGTTSPDPNYKLTIDGGLTQGGIKVENTSNDPAGYFSSAGGGKAIQTGAGTILFGNLSGTGTRMVVADLGGVLSTQAIPAAGVGGSGTTNYLAKFTDSASIGNSQIFDNGTNVGIGTTLTSDAKLHVVGKIFSYNSGGVGGQFTTGTYSGVPAGEFVGGTGIEVWGGYIKFPTISSGQPPAGDCADTSGLGRIKISISGSSNETIWICRYVGTTITWWAQP